MNHRVKEFFILSLIGMVALYPSLLIVSIVLDPYMQDFTLLTVVLIESIIIAPILQLIALPLAHNFIKRLTGL